MIIKVLSLTGNTDRIAVQLGLWGGGGIQRVSCTSWVKCKEGNRQSRESVYRRGHTFFFSISFPFILSPSFFLSFPWGASGGGGRGPTPVSLIVTSSLFADMIVSYFSHVTGGGGRSAEGGGVLPQCHL